MMQHLEEQQAIPVQKVMYFSDGAPAQYKNKTAFADLLCAEDFGVAAERHFFGTRHGNIWCNHCVHKTSHVPTLQQYQSYSCFCIIRVMIHCSFLSLCRQLQHIICSHWWKMAHPLKMPRHERRMERKYIPRTRHKSQQWLAILTSSKMMHEEMELVEEKTNRIPTIKLKISNAVYTYINCYAPNITTDIVNFLQQLQDEIQETETDSLNESLWTASNFNAALEQTDNIAGLPHHGRVVTTLKELLTNLDIHDIWSTNHPPKKNIKKSTHGLNQHCLLQEEWILKNCDTTFEPQTCQSYSMKRGPEYWTFNSSSLSEADFVADTISLMHTSVSIKMTIRK